MLRSHQPMKRLDAKGNLYHARIMMIIGARKVRHGIRHHYLNSDLLRGKPALTHALTSAASTSQLMVVPRFCQQNRATTEANRRLQNHGSLLPVWKVNQYVVAWCLGNHTLAASKC